MASKFFSTATKIAAAFLTLGPTPSIAGSIKDFKGSLFCTSGYGRNDLASSLVTNGVVLGGSKAWNSKLLPKSDSEGNRSKELRKWLATYCDSNKRPTRAIKEYIQWIVPKTESGIPVDQATALQKDLKEVATELAKSFFAFASTPSIVPKADVEQCSSDLFFYTLPMSATKGNPFPVAQKIKPGAETSFMFFASAEGSNSPIYLAANAMTRYAMPALQLGSDNNKRTTYDPDRTFKPGSPESVGYLSNILGGLWVSPGPMNIQVEDAASSSTKTVYPLRPFMYGESAVLRNSFVLFMPESEQRKVFGEVLTHATSPSEFIRDQEETWIKYFTKSTHFQESPSEDGRSIRFSVELELGPVCQFAIPTDDLLSK